LFTELKTNSRFEFSKLRVGIIYEGNLEEPRGTPLRMLRWAVLGAQYGAQINLLASSVSPEVANTPGVIVLGSAGSIIDNSDFVIVLNYNGLFRIRKLIKNSHCRVVVDLHSLRSRELSRLQALEFFRQTLIELASSFISRRNSALLVPVNQKMTRKYFANIGNKILEIQGGTTTNILRGIEYKYDFGYAGNTRQYQGLDFLLEAFDKLWQKGVIFSVLIISSEEFSDCEKRPYLTVLCKLNSNDALRKIAECRVLVVPRIKARENRYSFPSKVYDYLSTDSAILLSTEVPQLPFPLEATVLRAHTREGSEFGNSLLESLSILKHKGRFKRDFKEDYSWDTQFLKIVERILDEC
jgi:glycosyltransferase involved in cell wall biosynthesis